MIKKILTALLILAVATLGYLRFGRQPAPIDHNTFSYQMLQAGPYEVEEHQLELVDDSRPTAASGDYPGSDARLLVTRIWRPGIEGNAGPGPLLVYSHGFMSSNIGGTHLARHLASHGYTVAAPDFPLTQLRAPGPQQVRDVVNQPGDISFIIDTLLAHSGSDEANLFSGTIDPTRIAVAGLSLGGMTTSLLAFHPRLGDPRVAAAVSIAGPGFLFSPAFYAQRQLPFMMIASPIDPMVAYRSNARPLLRDAPGSLLVSIDNASHAGFSFQARALRWFDNPDQVGCWAIAGKADVDTGDLWYDELGSVEQGILRKPPEALCAADPLPPAMNPIHQQRLATLAVSSFLQSLFAPDAAERERHRQYLVEQFPYENHSVKVERAAMAR